MKYLQAFIIVAFLLAVPAMASEKAEHGKLLGASCLSCHGPDAKGEGYIPSIRGYNKENMVRKMSDFKDDKAFATVMGRIAKGYTNEEFEAMAEYFSALK